MDRFPEPVEAKKFLNKKIDVETDAWDDLKWGEHAHAFTVAHSIKAGVVNEIHGLLVKALSEGQAFQDFRKNILAMMEKTGWYGREDKTKDDKAYINWRIKIIFNTNMRTAHAAARYRKQLQAADLRPIWVYKSKLTGNNRRQEHIVLHNKAFRYDDPFWNSYYPPNGWECKCFVDTRSEDRAKREKLPVLASDEEGNPPQIIGVDWKQFADQTWKYNVGREALAPNFKKYTNIPKNAIKQVYANYHQNMNETRLTESEFKTIIKRTNEADYKTLNIMYQVGNLESRRFLALQKAGVQDSKIMATDYDLWHGTGDKNTKQKIPETLFDMVYQLLQEPECIFLEKTPGKSTQEKVFHFVKDTKDGKKIKIIVHVRTLANGQTAMQIRTMGYAEYDYSGGNYVEIKW